ncbi:MAG: C25 family cysteine peptidase [Bacteroidales bacterium]
MKRLLFLLMVLFTSYSAFSANDWQVNYSNTRSDGIKLTFEINNYQLINQSIGSDNFVYLDFNGGVNLEKRGYAALPFVHSTLKIDDLKNYSLKVVDSEYKDVDLDYPMLPSKGIITRDKNPQDIPYEIDPSSITNTWYPEEITKTSSPFILREYRGVNVYVSPFQYNAVKKKLRIYSSITVELTPNNSSSVNPLEKKSRVSSKEVQSMYKSIFLNANDISVRKDLAVADRGSLLIITTSRNENAIQPLIDWKKRKGMTVYKTVVPANTKVKSLIKEEYEKHNDILYVLLVGGWDDLKSETISNLGNAPTDPMLGCVVGEDVYPDLCIGRFCSNSSDGISNMVAKSINYEKNPSGDWYKSALAIASDQGPGDDNEKDYEHQNVIWYNKLSKSTYTKLYTAYEPLAKKSDISTAVNAGVSVVNYTGHGSITSWGTTGFNSSDVNKLNNGNKLPYIISVACDNGIFHKGQECFAETWTKKKDGGAIEILASTISQPWQPPMRGQDYFNDLLTGGYNYDKNPGSGINTDQGRTTFGSLVANSLILMYKESSQKQDLETLKTWTTFGDPSLQVRTDTPKEVTISEQVALSGVPFQTTISGDGKPVEDACVVLTDGEHIFKAYTNASGSVTINHSLIPGTAHIIVTGFNLKTVDREFKVVSPEQAYPIITKLTCATGNTNFEVHNGEKVPFNVTVQNVGKQAAKSVTAKLICEDSYVTVSKATVTVGDLDPSQKVIKNYAFEIKVANNVPDNHVIPLKIEVVSGQKKTVYTQNIKANAPRIVLDETLSMVDLKNNRLSFLKNSDKGALVYKVVNKGGAASEKVQLNLVCTNSGVTITNSQVVLPSVKANSSENVVFHFTVGDNLQFDSEAVFYLTMNYQDNSTAVKFTAPVNLEAEDFRTGDFSQFPWKFSGEENWTVVKEGVQGGYAAKSGSITDAQSSIMKININCQKEGNLEFKYKVSCEATYDQLRFYVDGKRKAYWSGELDWDTYICALTKGQHELKWVYIKDYMGTDGQDCAWITDIVFPNRIRVGVGVREVADSSNEFTIYPNPVNDHLKVRFNDNSSSAKNVSIYSLKGEKLQNVSSNGSEFDIKLSDTKFQTGMYIIKVIDSGKVYTKKFMKK